MPIMMAKLYDALRDVAGEDKARAAAIEAAEFDARIVKIDADLMLLKWMVGFNLALSAAILLKVFL
jgi:hypothetical protein